jgi:hypothetical protein
VLHSKLGFWPYSLAVDKAGKACQQQTGKLINYGRKMLSQDKHSHSCIGTQFKCSTTETATQVMQKPNKFDTSHEKPDKVNTSHEKPDKVDTSHEKHANIDTSHEKSDNVDKSHEKDANIDTSHDKPDINTSHESLTESIQAMKKPKKVHTSHEKAQKGQYKS